MRHQKYLIDIIDTMHLEEEVKRKSLTVHVRRRRLRFNRCNCGDRIIVERDPQSDEVPGEKIE
jgi:hypothetical protein